jgi:hypothetical protein
MNYLKLPILSTFANRYICFHVSKDFNFNILDALCSFLCIIAKGWWIFVQR